MEIHSSRQPALQAGARITEAIRENNKLGPVLILLSGGSALQVIAHIDVKVINQQCTFIMADERFSNDPTLNNFSQLTQTLFYKTAQQAGASFIETVPDTQKISPEDFATAIEKTLDYYLSTHKEAYVLTILGIGEDGHTASIFPIESSLEFRTNYHTNRRYIAVVAAEAVPNDRTTITPYFLKKHVHEVLLYATGEAKCEGVLQDLKDSTIPVNILPVKLASTHPNAHLYTDCRYE